MKHVPYERILVVAGTVLAMSSGCARSEPLAAPEGPSKNPPPPATETGLSKAGLDRELSNLASRKVSDSMEVLKSLGFKASDFDDLVSAKVVTADRVEKNLDDDPGMESLVHVTIQAKPKDDPEGQGSITLHALAWLDGTDAGLRPVGARVFRLGSCIIDSEFALEIRPVHTKSFDDVTIGWTDAPNCDGNYSLTRGTTTVAWIQDQPRTIFEFADFSMEGRVSGEEMDEQLVATFNDEIPRVVSIGVSGVRDVLFRMAFDVGTHRYGVVPELNPADAAGADRRGGKDWGNRCFKHIKAGRYSNALAACQKGLENPESTQAPLAGALYYNLGLIARNTGDRKGAADHFRKSLDVRPDNKTVQEQLRQVTASAP